MAWLGIPFANTARAVPREQHRRAAPLRRSTSTSDMRARLVLECPLGQAYLLHARPGRLRQIAACVIA